jgi:Mn2+/Fe2+ NRAMP family transporter
VLLPDTGPILRPFCANLGPGLITGASDDDPSGIGTYSQAGAQLGYGIGWTMLLTYPLMVAVQEISARIGRVSGRKDLVCPMQFREKRTALYLAELSRRRENALGLDCHKDKSLSLLKSPSTKLDP